MRNKNGLCQYNPHTRGENNIEIGLPEDSKIEVLLPIRDSEINEKVLEFILDLIYDHLNSYSEDKVSEHGCKIECQHHCLATS